MYIRRVSSNGFTLVEALTSILILALVWVAVAGSIISYKYIASYSKHKVQAVFVAQRILEEKRRQTFSTLANQNYGAVSIDTRGTFNTSADDLMGTAAVTVTNIDTYRKKVLVQVSWQEKSPIGVVTKSEFCATDIANEPQLN